MPRQQPPPGYMSATQAGEILGENMLYKYKRAGLLKHYKPPHRTYGYYLAADVYRLKEENREFFDVQGTIDAEFSRASFSDMEQITKLALKVFNAPHLVVPSIMRQQWLFKEPHGHYVVRQNNGNVIGYTHIIALPEHRIEALLRDDMRVAKDLTTDDIQAFQPGHRYTCYLVAIGIDPAIKEPRRRAAYSSVLLRGIGHDLAALGEKGVIIDKLYAYAEKNEGILLCAKMGMQQWAQPVKTEGPRRYTFYLDVLDSTIPFLQPYIHNITSWMDEHQEQEPQAPIIAVADQTPLSTSPPKERSSRPTQPQITPSGDEILLTHFARMHNVRRETLRDQFIAGRVEASERPIPSREGKTEKYFTLPQQRAVIEFWIRNGTPYTPCLDCPHGNTDQ